mgnify:CR=1 FL=1
MLPYVAAYFVWQGASLLVALGVYRKILPNDASRRDVLLLGLGFPAVLVCLGKPSTATLLGVTDGIRKTRGRWLIYKAETRDIRAMPTFHPAYLLRTPIEKRFAWRDFLAIRKALGN